MGAVVAERKGSEAEGHVRVSYGNSKSNTNLHVSFQTGASILRNH